MFCPEYNSEKSNSLIRKRKYVTSANILIIDTNRDEQGRRATPAEYRQVRVLYGVRSVTDDIF